MRIRPPDAPLFVLALLVAIATARSFEFINLCDKAVWPGLLTSSGPAAPETGWKADSCSSRKLQFEESWSGRVWARTGCSDDGSTCETGQCASNGLQCTGTGTPPATLAEFTLNGGGTEDNMDLSLVDGFNIEMAILPTASTCTQLACVQDLNANCPADLIKKNDAGETIACMTSCLARPSDATCCTGSHIGGPQVCPASDIPSYSYFKSKCPAAYAYAYDDAHSLVTCASSLKSDYQIVFCPHLTCPNGPSIKLNASATDVAGGFFGSQTISGGHMPPKPTGGSPPDPAVSDSPATPGQGQCDEWQRTQLILEITLSCIAALVLMLDLYLWFSTSEEAPSPALIDLLKATETKKPSPEPTPPPAQPAPPAWTAPSAWRAHSAAPTRPTWHAHSYSAPLPGTPRLPAYPRAYSAPGAMY